LDPLSRTLNGTEPNAVVAQHCLAESAVLPYSAADSSVEARNRYFTAALMRELQLDHVPYFCSFASGCAGFLSLATVAAGLFSSKDVRTAVCFMADSRPPCVTFDMQRERILGSDHSSAFLTSSKPLHYQLLGINYYSTARSLVPLFEIVKRTVQMIQGLAASLELNLSDRDVVIHYPNIFPETWQMVTRYLRLPRVEAVMDQMAERAHCGATDSIISLAKMHRDQADRLHVVVNYGIGLHLAVCVLKEQAIEKGAGKDCNGQKE
jgi:3-oxoacyl-[acyl-carrier-protein] synthase III